MNILFSTPDGTLKLKEVISISFNPELNYGSVLITCADNKMIQLNCVSYADTTFNISASRWNTTIQDLIMSAAEGNLIDLISMEKANDWLSVHEC